MGQDAAFLWERDGHPGRGLTQHRLALGGELAQHRLALGGKLAQHWLALGGKLAQLTSCPGEQGEGLCDCGSLDHGRDSGYSLTPFQD